MDFCPNCLVYRMSPQGKETHTEGSGREKEERESENKLRMGTKSDSFLV